MRNLTEGNKTNFAIFAVIIIGIIAVLVIFLAKTLVYEKEVYDVSKEAKIYDKNYELIDITSDATIEKKWDDNYYLTESETNLNYELGRNAIAFDSLKKRLNLYGIFYEITLDGEVKKVSKKTEISDMLTPKIYKIEDRKYLIVAENIKNPTKTIETENYLIVVIDKSGNTLLLNNEMSLKTINAITLETDTFTFDVANEKLLYNGIKTDLKKVIGSTNQYIENLKEEKEEKEEEKNENENKEGENQGTIGGGVATSSTTTTVYAGGATSINVGSNTLPGTKDLGSGISGGSSSNISNNSGIANNTVNKKNNTTIAKSVSLRSVTPGETYIDVEYAIVDPENVYQVVQLSINGDGMADNISLDKAKTFYRIVGLKQDTDYNIKLGYKIIKNNSTVEDVTEDILNVKTLKLQRSLSVTKITENNLTFNLKLDPVISYNNAQLGIYVNGVRQSNVVSIDTNKAVQTNGWNYSIPLTEDMVGKVTLTLENVPQINLSTSVQVY